MRHRPRSSLPIWFLTWSLIRFMFANNDVLQRDLDRLDDVVSARCRGVEREYGLETRGYARSALDAGAQQRPRRDQSGRHDPAGEFTPLDGKVEMPQESDTRCATR